MRFSLISIAGLAYNNEPGSVLIGAEFSGAVSQKVVNVAWPMCTLKSEENNDDTTLLQNIPLLIFWLESACQVWYSSLGRAAGHGRNCFTVLMYKPSTSQACSHKNNVCRQGDSPSSGPDEVHVPHVDVQSAQGAVERKPEAKGFIVTVPTWIGRIVTGRCRAGMLSVPEDEALRIRASVPIGLGRVTVRGHCC